MSWLNRFLERRRFARAVRDLRVGNPDMTKEYAEMLLRAVWGEDASG